jgi:hypothetical protein
MWAAGCQIDWRYNSITEQLIEVEESYWMRGEHPSALGYNFHTKMSMKRE